MFHYGLMIENGILMFLNAVGAFLQSLYVVLYLLVARPKVLTLMVLLVFCLYFCSLKFLSQYELFCHYAASLMVPI